MRRRRGWLESQRYTEKRIDEERSTPDYGRQAERAYSIRESKALTNFGRWIALQTEFCFDQSENYSKDDSG